MRILMLGRWIPPPRRPVRGTREYQFARHLARRHQLTIAFIVDQRDAVGPITVLRSEFGDLEFASVPRGWKSLASAVRLAGGESCTLSYFRSQALRTRLEDRLRRTGYDLVFVSSSSMIQYALEIGPTVPMVVDFGTVDSEWWVRQAARGSFPAARFFRTEAARLRAAETSAARRAALCFAETPEGAEIVRSLGAGAPVRVIPSGVEVGARGPAAGVDQPPTIVFSTAFRDGRDPKEALDFCRSIMAGVRARVPRARFVIASKDPVPGVRAGKEIDGLELVLATPDLRPLFHGRAVAVAPPGAGFDLRASVLEPMAGGIPVVTTPEVCERLGASPGRDVKVAGTAADFGLRLIELLESSSLREELGTRGRAFVEANLSWDTVTARLDQLLAGVVKPGPASVPTTMSRPGTVVRGG
jgi:glycosyltransferase involved in cell wall biosynthesis